MGRNTIPSDSRNVSYFFFPALPFYDDLKSVDVYFFGCGLTHLVFLGNFEFLSRPGGAKADAGPSE